MAEHKRGKMKNISGGVSDLICATNIFPLTRHVWPLQRVSCKIKIKRQGTVWNPRADFWTVQNHLVPEWVQDCLCPLKNENEKINLAFLVLLARHVLVTL